MSRVFLNVGFGMGAVAAVTTALMLACRRFAPRYEVHTANGQKIIEATDPTPWSMKMAAKILFGIGIALAATAALLQTAGITVPWL